MGEPPDRTEPFSWNDTIPSNDEVDPDVPELAQEGFDARYDVADRIGEGGMGVVHLCSDRRIGREIALKLAREGGLAARFLREARVQGRLEHPAVVPVYDLGRAPDGKLYFTMKRVRGRNLGDILERQRRGDAEAREQYTRRKLLTAFVNVCLAVDFAHSRGVLHRDLKPANVMLGDFGEVYVLDWGLARIQGVVDPTPAGDSQSAPGQTAAGALLGTPGYMAPEQARGEHATLDGRADVFSLGAILFEILTGEPLIPRRSLAEMIADTVTGPDARPSVRAPDADVPPELELVCLRATRLDRDKRFLSPRELCRAVERYLEGDRDLELRRELAETHGRAARAAAERALETGGLAERKRALVEIGRALALDPNHQGAMATLVGLLAEPPIEVPEQANQERRALERDRIRSAARSGLYAYSTWFLFVPFMVWMGIKGTAWLAAAAAAWGLALVLAFVYMRRPPRDGRPALLMVVASAVAVASTWPIFGTFVLVPPLAAFHTLTFMLTRDHARRVQAMTIGVLTVAAPAVAEVLGLLPRTTVFTGETMVVTSQMLHLPPTASYVFLSLLSVAMVIVVGVLTARLRDTLMQYEDWMRVHTWHLRQLVPENAAWVPTFTSSSSQRPSVWRSSPRA
ncbi:MAG TPA: serine/threonine-protein kinase [Haliangiales bacterium]|nr:serine/threonine-protein kinase [Haliangiales bacterium]